MKKKKEQLPQWMLDLKTPVKRPKLPLPGFYQSPDELKPQACIDEWARVSQMSMGSTGVLTDVLSPLDFDAADGSISQLLPRGGLARYHATEEGVGC